VQLRRHRSFPLGLSALALVLFASTTAEAGILTRLRGIVSRKTEGIYHAITADESHVKLMVRGEDNPLHLDSLVGRGWNGAVYGVHPGSAKAFTPDFSGSVIAKRPHVYTWGLNHFGAAGTLTAQSAARPTRRLRAEAKERTFLDTRAKDFERAPAYPADPAWRRGTVPVVPILRELETERGPVLLKPRVAGVSLGDLYRRHGEQMPEAVVRSAREIYQFVQAVGETVQVRGGGRVTDEGEVVTTGKPLALDARPANLTWVEGKQEMAALGLKRPSFMFVELDQSARNTPVYLKQRTSFPDYLSEMMAVARHAALKP
jgi:hypothetical protein